MNVQTTIEKVEDGVEIQLQKDEITSKEVKVIKFKVKKDLRCVDCGEEFPPEDIDEDDINTCKCGTSAIIEDKGINMTVKDDNEQLVFAAKNP